MPSVQQDGSAELGEAASREAGWVVGGLGQSRRSLVRAMRAGLDSSAKAARADPCVHRRL